jgi:precorrin-2/cobalt-factor-2 C20-methyltransferase
VSRPRSARASEFPHRAAPGQAAAEAADHDRAARTDAAVIMKLGRNLPKVRTTLDELGLTGRAIYVERGTMAGETVTPLPQKVTDEAPYFSMILIPGRGRLL